MTVKELKKLLDKIGVPDTAEVYVEADHGQNKENAANVIVSRCPADHKYFGDPDAMVWEYSNYRDVYDEDALDEYNENGPVTAVLITY